MNISWRGGLTRVADKCGAASVACDSAFDTLHRFGVSPCRLETCRWVGSGIAASIKGGGAARLHGRAPKYMPASAQRGLSGAGGWLRPLPGQRQGDDRALDRRL